MSERERACVRERLVESDKIKEAKNYKYIILTFLDEKKKEKEGREKKKIIIIHPVVTKETSSRPLVLLKSDKTSPML